MTRAVTIRARTGSHFQRAKLIMVTGDLLEAVALGTQALDWAGPLRSTRILDKLRDLNRLAEPHVNLPEVADLRACLAAWHQSRAVAAHHHPEISASRSMCSRRQLDPC